MPIMIDTSDSRAAFAAAKVQPNLEKCLTSMGLFFGDPVYLRAFKSEKMLELFVRHRTTKKYMLFRTYRIVAMSGELGPKLAEGDHQVPEGFYTVQPTAMNPKSRYHLSFNIGYPNIFDLEHQRTGSAIMVHGNQVSAGCLAMTDEKIEEIYTLCAAAHRAGQAYFKIDIFPARMTDGWMGDARGNLNEKFWQNLKEGYDIFERNHVPPEVSVVGGRYQFQ